MRKRLLFFLLLFAAAPLFADDATKFLIQRIDVRNLKHVSADVVRSETRLRIDQAYSEEELRQASDRVSRLPFVLDAQFSLEKGTVRDSYVLVINVIETRRFFYQFDAISTFGRHGQTYGIRNNGLAAGVRTFIGRSGSLHAGIGAREEIISTYSRRITTAEAGYTRYNLFGTNAFATFSVGIPVDDNARAEHLLPQLVVGIPLTQTQTLTAKITTSDIRFPYRFPGFPEGETRAARRALRVTWSRNTTDHPFAPTRGSILSFGPLVARDDQTMPVQFYDREHVFHLAFEPEHTSTIGFDFVAARYVPVGERNTAWLLIDGDLRRAWSRMHVPNTLGQSHNLRNQGSGDVVLGFAHSLWSPEKVAKYGDSRLEGTLRYQRTPWAFPGDHVFGADFAWVHRHVWGSSRIGVGYLR
jgi:outer membrane protein assembly factor BamA